MSAEPCPEYSVQFPRKTLDQALRVPEAIEERNGGNPWVPAQLADAIGVGAKTSNFFYITASSRDFGLTEGIRDSAEISITESLAKSCLPRQSRGREKGSGLRSQKDENPANAGLS